MLTESPACIVNHTIVKYTGFSDEWYMLWFNDILWLRTNAAEGLEVDEWMVEFPPNFYNKKT